jgi:hypothetical protein
MGSLAAFFEQQSGEMDFEVNRLRAEVADLKALLAAKATDADAVLFTISIPPGVTAQRYDGLMTLWREQWALLGKAAPPVFPIVDGMAIEKLYHDGYGLYVIRVPDDLSMDAASRLASVWDHSWKGTDTPTVPMVVMARSLDVTRLSAQTLQSMGLMRIPDALMGPG